MNTKTCPKCQARWIGGQHYWATGATGNEADLAGLVCDNLGDDTCINPLRGTKHEGDSWERRYNELKVMDDRLGFNDEN